MGQLYNMQFLPINNISGTSSNITKINTKLFPLYYLLRHSYIQQNNVLNLNNNN